MFRLTNLVILDRKSWWEYSLEWLADQCERLSSNLNSSVNKIIIDVEIGLNNVLIIMTGACGQNVLKIKLLILFHASS